MARKKKKGRKVRVDFRTNREQPRRADDLTRQYRDAAARDDLEDQRLSESIRAKGALSRKRTIIVDENEDPLADESQWRRGLVTQVHGLISRVERDDGQPWDCTVRRVLRSLLIEQRSGVTVGDRVWFSDQSTHHDGEPIGVIERVAERVTVLSRRDRRGREHAIVANADQLVIVASVAQPRIKPHLIDRYLVAAARGNLRPVVVFNKWDLIEESERDRGTEGPRDQGEENGEWRMANGEKETPDDDAGVPASTNSTFDIQNSAFDSPVEIDFDDDAYSGPPMTIDDLFAEFESLGYCCIRTSTVTSRGLDALRRELVGRMTVFSGQSGVGKSSLLNAISPGLNLTVREVSEESEKGKHTTSLASLIRVAFTPLPEREGPGEGQEPEDSERPQSHTRPTAGGALNASTTPDVGHVVDTPGIRQFDLWNVEPGELEACFTEFTDRVQHCRFNDCHHRNEEGCAIQAAVESGEISPRRYVSYLKMLEESASFRGH